MIRTLAIGATLPFACLAPTTLVAAAASMAGAPALGVSAVAAATFCGFLQWGAVKAFGQPRVAKAVRMPPEPIRQPEPVQLRVVPKQEKPQPVQTVKASCPGAESALVNLGYKKADAAAAVQAALASGLTDEAQVIRAALKAMSKKVA